MTQPTFEQLLASQEARDKVKQFRPDKAHGSHWMTPGGVIWPIKHDGDNAIWQGWLTDCEPPPEPRVFREVVYFNFHTEKNLDRVAYHERKSADFAAAKYSNLFGERLACVRVEITATEGQFDD